MSTCLEALEDLSERYDDVEYFLNLHQATLYPVHRLILQERLCVEPARLWGDLPLALSTMHDVKYMATLPEAEFYSHILEVAGPACS